MARTLVLTSTFPQWEGDPRGAFIRRYWEARVGEGAVEVLAPRTRWCTGELHSPLRIHRFCYAPKSCSTLSGQFGILENLRARPHRSSLVPPFLLAMFRALRRRIAAGDVEQLVAHMAMPCGVVAGLALEGTDIPLQVFGHGTDVDLLLRLPKPMRELCAAPLERAQQVHLPSAEKRERVRAALPRLAGRCEIADMVETVERVPARWQPVPGRILFMGRLIRQKGVDELIRAVVMLDQPEVELHIAGDGPERARLTRLAARTGVRAVFHGFVEGTRKHQLLASAAVLCVPSRDVGGLSEGAPLVIREAGLVGLPVVATRAGGIPELARHCPGLHLVEQGHTAALSAGLRAVLRSCAR